MTDRNDAHPRTGLRWRVALAAGAVTLVSGAAAVNAADSASNRKVTLDDVLPMREVRAPIVVRAGAVSDADTATFGSPFDEITRVVVLASQDPATGVDLTPTPNDPTPDPSPNDPTPNDPTPDPSPNDPTPDLTPDPSPNDPTPDPSPNDPTPDPTPDPSPDPSPNDPTPDASPDTSPDGSPD